MIVRGAREVTRKDPSANIPRQHHIHSSATHTAPRTCRPPNSFSASSTSRASSSPRRSMPSPTTRQVWLMEAAKSRCHSGRSSCNRSCRTGRVSDGVSPQLGGGRSRRGSAPKWEVAEDRHHFSGCSGEGRILIGEFRLLGEPFLVQ